MLFRDLYICNKDWDLDTEMVIISKDGFDVRYICARAAFALFGSRPVLWFKGCEVMLL